MASNKLRNNAEGEGNILAKGDGAEEIRALRERKAVNGPTINLMLLQSVQQLHNGESAVQFQQVQSKVKAGIAVRAFAVVLNRCGGGSKQIVYVVVGGCFHSVEGFPDAPGL